VDDTVMSLPIPTAARRAPGEIIPWRILIVTLLGSALSNMDQSLFGYAVPGVMADLGISLSGIGVLISLSFAAAIGSASAIGPITHLLGARRVLALCLGISAALVGLQALASTTLLFGAARVAGFAVSAAYPAVACAYLATSTPLKRRAIALAIQQCGYPLGWFIASLFAAPLIANAGWRAIFLVAFAVIPLAGFFYVALPVKSEPSSRDATRSGSSGSTLRQLLTPAFRRVSITFGLAFFLYGGAIGGTAFYLPTFFQQARGYDAKTATLVVGVSYAVGMIGYLSAALISEYWLSRRTTVVVWLCLAAAGLLAATWLPRSSGEDIALFGATAVFLYGSSSIMLTSLLEHFPAQLRTTAAALSGTACISLGFVVFPIVTAAAVANYGWLLSFTFVIVPAVAAAAALILSLPRDAVTRILEQLGATEMA